MARCRLGPSRVSRRAERLRVRGSRCISLRAASEEKFFIHILNDRAARVSFGFAPVRLRVRRLPCSTLRAHTSILAYLDAPIRDSDTAFRFRGPGRCCAGGGARVGDTGHDTRLERRGTRAHTETGSGTLNPAGTRNPRTMSIECGGQGRAPRLRSFAERGAAPTRFGRPTLRPAPSGSYTSTYLDRLSSSILPTHRKLAAKACRL